MYQTFAAKKRAEIAPGVGQATDMFAVGPTLGAVSAIEPVVIDTLGAMYGGIEHVIAQGIAEALDGFNKQVGHSIEEGIQRARQQAAAQTPDPGEITTPEGGDKPT
jgi:hypothetical protein